MNREHYMQLYEIARKNLLIMLVLTIVNVVLVAVNSGVIMLFSATIPYFALSYGMYIAAHSYSSTMLYLSIVLAVILIILYLICYLMSKKHYGWLIFATVMFVLDTLAMIGLYISVGEVSSILDIIIHILVLYYLISGSINGYKLSHLPQEEQSMFSNVDDARFYAMENNDDAISINDNETSLYKADMNVKYRVLLESNVYGHEIVYRRIKRTNELVVDGYVYDTYQALAEKAHCLNAKVDGHLIQVGYNGIISSYLKVDGQTVLKKIRWY